MTKLLHYDRLINYLLLLLIVIRLLKMNTMKTIMNNLKQNYLIVLLLLDIQKEILQYTMKVLTKIMKNLNVQAQVSQEQKKL